MSSISQNILRQSTNSSTRAAAANIRVTYGGDVVHRSTLARWDQHFDDSDISVEDRSRLGYSSLVDNTALFSALAANLRLNELCIPKLLSVLVPHELRDSDKASQLSLCGSIVNLPSRKNFLKDIPNGSENWVSHVPDHYCQRRT
ncbi:hypothetical protein Y032_1131g3660 [Ancylostoma ceylanicum]|uniref:Mos1 transposase HTH domain-containing protein n=1 Tax=Ancylostoma ceylanicum TaxID=53326 RepID=A0A016W837_9BILA|nr:hypothetical protein Y032_1131g3660 [Ancylostoma ceylanicum]